MNIVEALRHQPPRPIRRASWLNTGPMADGDPRADVIPYFWISPRLLMPAIPNSIATESIFVNIATGTPLALRLPDYLGDDWEVMP